jgi:hypothetical protein
MTEPTGIPRQGYTMDEIHSAASAAVMLRGAKATNDDVRRLMQGQSDALIAAVLQKHRAGVTKGQQSETQAADAEDLKLYVKEHIRAYTFGLLCTVIGVLALQLITLVTLAVLFW